jgi:restriction endonuclease S subunit
MDTAMLDTYSWQPFKLKDLFAFYRGKGITNSEIFENQGNIPCIQSGENNNGIIGYMDDYFINDKKHTFVQAPFISVARSGTSGTAYVQKESSYIGDSVYALKLHSNENILTYLFLTTLLNKERYRYGYGRKVSIEKYIETFIKLPIDKQGIPNWKYMRDFLELFLDYSRIETKITEKELPFDTALWKTFNLGDLFTVVRGKRLTKENRTHGDLPLATAGENNEGISAYISNEEMQIYSNILTIDMFCNCFYRGYKFTCDDNILVLFPKFKHTMYTLLFMATVINADKYRYAYGKQYRQKSFYGHSIKLPATSEGSPDWQFMENYIRSLPYSDII